MESSRVRNDSLLLVVLGLAALARNCYFVEEMHSIYDTIWIAHFGNFLRSLQNKSSFHDRSVFRNIIFDVIRSCVRPYAYPFLFEKEVDTNFFLQMVASCIVSAIIVTLFVPKSFLERNRVVYAYAQVELIMMYPEGTLYFLNRFESVGDGRVIYFLIGFYLECHFGLQGNILEDLLFRDLNQIGGLIKNWQSYIYQQLLFSSWFVMQYLQYGQAVLRPHFSFDFSRVQNLISPDLRFPVRWHQVLRTNKNDHIYYQVGMSLWALLQLWQLTNWFRSLEAKKMQSH